MQSGAATLVATAGQAAEAFVAARNVRAELGSDVRVASTVGFSHREWADGFKGAWASGLPLAWAGPLPTLPQAGAARLTQLIAKRCADIILSVLGLIALSPLLLAVAAAIKLTSSGSVLFRQTRTGRDNVPFQIYKFRTMYADKMDASGVDQTRSEDERVTPLGRVLRNKSIDELPQLINVLRGEMSLVGPRPHVPGMRAGGVTYEDLVPYYDLRHAMTPGITGWAQANRLRGPTDSRILAVARVDHDIAYIQNFSLWLDGWILLKTVWVELAHGTGL